MFETVLTVASYRRVETTRLSFATREEADAQCAGMKPGTWSVTTDWRRQGQIASRVPRVVSQKELHEIVRNAHTLDCVPLHRATVRCGSRVVVTEHRTLEEARATGGEVEECTG